MNFADILRVRLPRDIFTEMELKMAFAEKSEASLLSGLSRSLQSKDLVRLKRGLYVFGDRLRRAPIAKFSVANKLYVPSYVSFESALAFHGLIPEAVYVTTSACQQPKKKYFKTTLGDFSYDYIPCSPFFMGVESHAELRGQLLANPVKALFDLIYQRRKNYPTLADLEKDLRVDIVDLKKAVAVFSYQELSILAQSYRKKNTTHFLNVLAKETK